MACKLWEHDWEQHRGDHQLRKCRKCGKETVADGEVEHLQEELASAASCYRLLTDQLRNALGQPDLLDDQLVTAVGAQFVELANARHMLERCAEVWNDTAGVDWNAYSHWMQHGGVDPFHALCAAAYDERSQRVTGLEGQLVGAEKQRDDYRGKYNALVSRLYETWLDASTADKAKGAK